MAARLGDFLFRNIVCTDQDELDDKTEGAELGIDPPGVMKE